MGRQKENKASWIEHAHLFRSDTYECSHCHSKYKTRTKICPNCKFLMTDGKYDPQWIDELEMFDAIFDD